MTREDIQAVLDREPTLTYYGIRTNKEPGELDANREALLNCVDQCARVCTWLSGQQMTKTVNREHSSYGYKHMAERATGDYVSNGVFIAAAIHCGFPYRKIPNSPNVQFGISEKGLPK
jgi:hypothetical protein